MDIHKIVHAWISPCTLVQVQGDLVRVAVHGELMEGGLQDGRPAQDTRARPYYALGSQVIPGW